MYIIKNALENLVTNKGRNILISASIFAIVVTTVVALIINNTASAVIEDYRDRFSSEVSITPNFEKVREEAMQDSSNGRVTMRIPSISPELLLSFTESDALQKYDASGYLTVDSNEIKAIDQSEDTDSSTGNAPGGGGMVSMNTAGVMMRTGMNTDAKPLSEMQITIGLDTILQSLA